MNMFQCIRIILLFGFFTCAFAKIVINKLSGADSAQIGTNSTTLKCDYEYENETSVEVKWFYNSHVQIYNWIPFLTQPTAMGQFSNVMEVDEYTIHFTNMTREMRGNYTCKVSSDEDEKVETRLMVPYEFPSDVDFFLEEESETLLCTVSEVYPEPIITVDGAYIVKRNNSVPIINQKTAIIETEDNLYNVTSLVTLDLSSVTESIEFVCKIHIQDTDFERTLTTIYSVSSNETFNKGNIDNSTFETSLNEPTSTQSTQKGQLLHTPTVWLLVIAMFAIMLRNS